jgi:Aspartate-semialdehyde dehydrogenase
MKSGVVAIVGGDSLLGREIREVADSLLPQAQLKLVGTDRDESAVLTEQGGEAVVITQLDEENLRGAKAVVFAGSAESTHKALDMMAEWENRPPLVDLTQNLEDQPQARVRAPMVEPEGFQVEPDAIHVVAHPASIALALFFGRLHRHYPLRQSVVQIFEPASERGQRGLNELQQQTVGLLSFQTLSKEVFDEQVSFNMLSRYGADAPQSLQDIELRIDRHLTTLLSRTGKITLPSLRLAQAPVFHGYTFSIWAQFESNPGPQALNEALASALIEVRSGEEDPPTNVGVAGHSGIIVGSVEQDRNNASAVWFWAVADNLRLVAENGMLVLQSLLSVEAVQ